jgi:predicted RNase H-like HicB family nuclease
MVAPSRTVVASREAYQIGSYARLRRRAAPEEEGGFTVRILSFPEVVAYGKDEREALVMAEDAIRLVLEDCAARGERAPGL